MIRKHVPSDLEQILEVWSQASTLAHPFLSQDIVEKVKKDMRDKYIPNSETWVYEEDRKVLGFIGMMGNEIGGLFVLPTHHSKGIGSKLVNYIMKDHKVVEVEVFKMNAIGRAFYDKYGFVFVKEEMNEHFNQMVIRMRYGHTK